MRKYIELHVLVEVDNDNETPVLPYMKHRILSAIGGAVTNALSEGGYPSKTSTEVRDITNAMSHSAELKNLQKSHAAAGVRATVKV